jgi:hypothetical protein
MRPKVEPANVTAFSYGEEPPVERPLAAAGTAAPKPRLYRRDCRPALVREDVQFPCLVDYRAAGAPLVDGAEEEQPHDIDEMPVPRRCLETEMMIRLEVIIPRAEVTDDEKDGADDDMESVEAGRHVKYGRVTPPGRVCLR